MSDNFSSIDEIKEYINKKEDGSLNIFCKVSDEYAGVVESVAIIFNTQAQQISLHVAWDPTGIGSSFDESYEYSFSDLASLLNYVEKKYNLKVNDIKKETRYPSNMPVPWDPDEKTNEYKIGWEKLKKDFETGKLLDKDLILIHST